MKRILLFAAPAVFSVHCAASTPIGIDTGRQLFVDDYLVESSDGIVRNWNKPVKMDNPVIWPGGGAAPKVTDGSAAPGEQVTLTYASDGGLWWDPERRCFRLWYNADWLGDICYAESKNGVDWEYPNLGIVPGTNRIFERDTIDSWCVVPNYAAPNPFRDWKLHISFPYGINDDRLWSSTDGIRFDYVGLAGRSNDRSTMYYDPFRGLWIFSLRDAEMKPAYSNGIGRCRRYFASRTFGGGQCRWNWPNGARIAGHPKDAPIPEKWLRSANKGNVELYSFNAVAYESLMLGVMEMLYNTPRDNEACMEVGLPKDTRLHFCFSRDGKNYERREEADISPSGQKSGRWDAGYLSPVGGICVIKDERLWFYYSGVRGDSTRLEMKKWHRNGMYCNGAIGVATLRRDGFAGMVANGDGEIVTKPLAFTGRHLFVNAESLFGSISAEILGEDGKPVVGFTCADCAFFEFADSTKKELKFKGGDLSRFADRPVRIRFRLRCSTLYSFWVSPSPRGESRGYVAGGGPDYSGLRDL